MKWLERSATGGEPTAHVVLGLCYRNSGVPTDKVKCLHHLETGARLGNIGGARELGIVYAADGIIRGMKGDPVEAYKWTLITDEPHHRDPPGVWRIDSRFEAQYARLSKGQAAEARARAQKWLDENPALKGWGLRPDPVPSTNPSPVDCLPGIRPSSAGRGDSTAPGGCSARTATAFSSMLGLSPSRTSDFH